MTDINITSISILGDEIKITYNSITPTPSPPGPSPGPSPGPPPGPPPGPDPNKSETCYSESIDSTGNVWISNYDQNDSFLCTNTDAPGCWKSGKGRPGVDASVAIPYAWFDTSGVTNTSNEFRKGNCTNPITTIIGKCSGGSLESCTSNDDCDSNECVNNKCRGKTAQICRKDTDCILSSEGKKSNPERIDGRCVQTNGVGVCDYLSGDWSAHTCNCTNCYFQTVQGATPRDKIFGSNNYNQGEPLCWELTSISTDTSTVTNKIIVQADAVCGGSCGCGEDPTNTCISGNNTECNRDVCHKSCDECQKNPECLPDYKCQACLDCAKTWDVTYQDSNRCYPADLWHFPEDKKDERSTTVIPEDKINTDVSVYANTPLKNPGLPDWCGGKYMHFDVRANSKNDMVWKKLCGENGICKVTYKRIKCPDRSPLS